MSYGCVLHLVSYVSDSFDAPKIIHVSKEKIEPRGILMKFISKTTRLGPRRIPFDRTQAGVVGDVHDRFELREQVVRHS